ncbi:MAG TPA: glutamate formimidoyltransferase [Gemmatimonadales bacterium]|nr:glutamate formimidoyltransferase [Gemmatimonadales bacterium]
MTRIVECVPNFSEGRSPEILAALREAIASVPGARLLDVQSDAAHNRSVFTLIGAPEAVSEAAFRAMRVAAQRIDLNQHRGEHPRMGATDVVPFVPVEGVSMDECVTLARALGERVGRELGIPVFLYARAAARPDRVSLPAIRKGEFEGLRDRIGSDPDRTPDFGPNRIHPTAGCTAIGARPFLAAYNIYLDTPDVSVAEAIAREIRESSGGLPAVQAKGFHVDGRAQVSMNLLDIDVTPPAVVFAAVSEKAAARGVRVWKSEIVGLIPERAVWGAAQTALKLDSPVESHLLERKVREALGPTLDGWIDDLASGAPTPGGGSAAALAGALAAALVAMVGRLTTSRKAYAAVAEEFAEITNAADRLRAQFRDLVDRDAQAYESVMAAYKLPKGSDDEQRRRAEAIDQALLDAATVPLETARAAVELLSLARRAAEAGNKNAVCDAGVAALLAEGALRGAVYNVEINVRSLANREAGSALSREARELDHRGAAEAGAAARAVAAGLAGG